MEDTGNAHRYLWDTSYVVSKLRGRSLTEGVFFAYFLAVTAFDWLQFTVLRTAAQPTLTTWTLVGAWITFALTVCGLIYLFVCNGGADGRDFLYRYFPLAVVVGWKFVVLTVVALFVIGQFATGTPRDVLGWVTVGVVAAINVLLFLRIGAWLHHLDSTQQSTATVHEK